MRIVERIETIAVTEKVLNIVCNKCGKSSIPDYTNTVQNFQLPFGYGSMWDGMKLQSELCESCIEEMIHGFMIQADIIG